MVCKEEPRGAKPFLPGLVKIQANYTNNTTPASLAANVLHVRWSDSVNHSQSDLNSIGAAFAANWAGVWATIVHSSWSTTGFTLTSLGGDGLIATETVSEPGTQGGQCMPPQCAVCLSWRAPITARGGRGRSYLPGVPSSGLVSTAGAALTSTYASQVKSQFTAFLNSWNAVTVGGATAPLVIPSYYHNCQLRPVPLALPVSGLVVHDRLDTQRRRLGKERSYQVT